MRCRVFCLTLNSLPAGSWCRVAVSSIGPKSALSVYGVGEGHVFQNCYVPRSSLSDSSKRIIVWLHGGVIDLYAGTKDDVEVLDFVEHVYGEDLSHCNLSVQRSAVA